jgi:cytochrome c peroxidase
MATLGEKLFRDVRLSRDARRSCATCHEPARAFSDGKRTPPSLLPDVPIARNTPTLLYAPIHAAQLWDGKLASAESQALGVIHAETEMGLVAGELELTLRADAKLQAAFATIFPDGLVTANVARALVAYQVRDLVPATAPIDRFARGDLEALSADHLAGLDVFAGVGRCARCHVPPLFGGSRPLDFAVPIYAALGVPSEEKGKVLDADRGRGAVTHNAIDAHAFKTPTVRNIERTAPYFHNGAFATLASVVDFYVEGGGRARGIALDNQDPDVRKLELSAEQKRVLTLFMREALSDAP